MAQEEDRFWEQDLVVGDTTIGEATEDLEGRAIDVGFEATRDPVGAAQEAYQYVASGEAEGLEIPTVGPQPGPFPLEPGESRAAQELPELFVGIQPSAPGFMGPQMPALGTMSGPLGTLDPKSKLQISSAAMTMFDPSEVVQMIMQKDPETGERRWPELRIMQAPDGTYIVHNSKTGAEAIVNRPGMSTHDVLQALGIGTMFVPAARVATAFPSLAGRIAFGATAAGATEHVIQLAQELAGGEYDPLDVALTAGLAPIAELGRPLIGLWQRGGKTLKSYIPESILGWKPPWYGGGIKPVVPESLGQALDFAKNQKQYLQSGREAILLTQDAVPEVHTPFRQILLKRVERLPLFGTGKKRKVQEQQRIEVLRHMVDRYDLNPNTNYGLSVIDDLNRNAGKQMTVAKQQADDTLAAVSNMNSSVTGEPILVNLKEFRFKIRDLLAAETKYGDMADKKVVDLLNKVRNSVWQGGAKMDYGRQFGVVNDWLERLYVEAASAPPAAQKQLLEAATALRKDLERTAAEEAGDTGRRWALANAELDRLSAEAQKRTWDSLLEAGEIDQGLIRTILKSGDEKSMQRMFVSMTPEGRNAARQMILRNATKVAGWRRGKATEAPIDPDQLLKWINTDAVSKQLDIFFPDEVAQAELNGLREYLKLTAQAAQTGKGVGMAAAGGGMGQFAANTVNFLTLGAVGGLGHAYQSKVVRNLLARLYHIKGDQRQVDAWMREAEPVLLAAGRQMMQNWSENDPQDLVLASDEFIAGYDAAGMPKISTRVEGEEEPGLMEQLRTAVGYEPGGGIGQIFGFGEDEEQE